MDLKTVDCPVCECKLEGMSDKELSDQVREHFCEEHGMERPKFIESTSVMTYGSPSPVGGLKVEDATLEGGQNVDQPVRELGTAWKEATTERVECPACRELMEGCDCTELSTRLAEHMRTAHREEGFMKRAREKIRGE